MTVQPLWTDETVEPYRSGSTEPWTVDILRALIQATVPPVIVETGTFEAKTTIQLAQVAPWAKIYTVECDVERAEAAHALLAPYPHVEVVRADALEFLRGLPDESVGFAFLDDDHSPFHVDQEFRALKPKMALGGLITCHDVFGGFNLGAVVATHHGYSLQLIRLHRAGGLGLWQRQQ